MQCHGELDLTFDFAVVTLTYISETVRCRKLILGRDIGYGLEVWNIMV